MDGKVTHTIKKWVNANQLHSLPQKDLLTYSPGCDTHRCVADEYNSIAINNEPFGARKANVYVGIRENSDGNTLFFASNDTQSNADLLVKVHQLQLPDEPPGGWKESAPRWHMGIKYTVGDLVRRDNELETNLHRVYVAVQDHTSTVHTVGTISEQEENAWNDDSNNWRSLDNGYRGTWKEGSHYLKGDIVHQASLFIGEGFYVAVRDHIATRDNSAHAQLGHQTTWRQMISKGSEITEIWRPGVRYYIGDIVNTVSNGKLRIYRCIETHTSTADTNSVISHSNNIKKWVELPESRDRGLYNENLYYRQGDTVMTLSGDDNDVFNAFIARQDHQPTDNTHPLNGSLTLEYWYHIGSADPPDVTAVEGLGDITKTWGTTTKFRKGDLVTWAGDIYMATAGHTSGASWHDDQEYWINIEAPKYRGTWTAGVYYRKGDIVSHKFGGAYAHQGPAFYIVEKAHVAVANDLYKSPQPHSIQYPEANIHYLEISGPRDVDNIAQYIQTNTTYKRGDLLTDSGGGSSLFLVLDDLTTTSVNADDIFKLDPTKYVELTLAGEPRSWAIGHQYAWGQMIQTASAEVFFCISDHTATVNNKPELHNATSRARWVQMTDEDETREWSAGEEYHIGEMVHIIDDGEFNAYMAKTKHTATESNNPTKETAVSFAAWKNMGRPIGGRSYVDKVTITNPVNTAKYTETNANQGIFKRLRNVTDDGTDIKISDSIQEARDTHRWRIIIDNNNFVYEFEISEYALVFTQDVNSSGARVATGKVEIVSGQPHYHRGGVVFPVPTIPEAGQAIQGGRTGTAIFQPSYVVLARESGALDSLMFACMCPYMANFYFSMELIR